MVKKEKTLLQDSLEMMEIFREMPKEEQTAALAYAIGAAGKPFETLMKANTCRKSI